jgi:hypothetical protein
MYSERILCAGVIPWAYSFVTARLCALRISEPPAITGPQLKLRSHHHHHRTAKAHVIFARKTCRRAWKTHTQFQSPERKSCFAACRHLDAGTHGGALEHDDHDRSCCWSPGPRFRALARCSIRNSVTTPLPRVIAGPLHSRVQTRRRPHLSPHQQPASPRVHHLTFCRRYSFCANSPCPIIIIASSAQL